ncbi:MAG: T9SS type A sorting domain-containing protein, partial [Bacteroidota bacterium]
NLNVENYLVLNNTIENAIIGIRNRRISSSGINRIRENLITNTTTPMTFGMTSREQSGTIIELNDFIDNNTSGFSSYGINLSGSSYDNLLRENTIQSNDSYIGISLNQAMMNDLCCNTSSGAAMDLRIFGTNTSTNIRNSILDNGRFVLQQSSIGVQEHTGNRWQPGSIGELISTNEDLAIQENRFIVNNIESNTTDGLIKPEITLPSSISNSWFQNDPFNSSDLCSQVSNTNCNIASVPNFVLPPNINPYTPGPCEPFSLDIDNDGVCDDIDPDPLDACVPNSQDSDNDGICDGIDRDPTDGNNPYSTDSDGDGRSDVLDSDVLNPCIPNGVDQDNDGVCASFDPDDLDPLVPIKPTIVPTIVKDLNNNNFITTSIRDGQPTRSIREIESLIDKNFGNHSYELVNQWENDFALLNFLLHNQYYLSLSEKIKNYWTNKTSNTLLWDYVKVAHDMKVYAMMMDFEYRELVIQTSYLDRINSMIVYYSENYNSVFLETLIQNKEIIDSEIKAYTTANKEDRQDKLIALRNEINNLSSPDIFQDIQKQVWLKELIHEERGLSDTDITELNTIAYLCPLEYGSGVYGAQSLLMFYESLNFDALEDLCLNSGNRLLSANEMVEEEIKLYPNPTSHSLAINSPNKILSLEILQNGRLIETMTLNGKQGNFDLSQFANGVYQIRIITQDKTCVKQVIKME